MSPVEQSWTPIVGRQAAKGLAWLERAAGASAVQKFMGGKVRGTGFSGQYVCGIAHTRKGRELVAALLVLLRRGQMAPLSDVDSYYAVDKRWPVGMRIVGGRLVDVWSNQAHVDSRGVTLHADEKQ